MYSVYFAPAFLDPLGTFGVEGPEAAIVSFIRKETALHPGFLAIFDAARRNGLQQDLNAGDQTIIERLLVELRRSANPDPAPAYASWYVLLETKEFRKFIRAKVRIECYSESGPICSDEKEHQYHHGWTPIRNALGGTIGYSPGEGKSPTVSRSLSDSCVTYEFKHQSRLGKVGQFFAELALGSAVPWIWGDIKYTLCCDGTFKILYSGSHFPSHFAYLNRRKVGEDIQSDLPGFLFNTPDRRARGGVFHSEP